MRLGDCAASVGEGFWRACPEVGCGHHMHSKGVHEIQDDPRSVAAQKEQSHLRFVPNRYKQYNNLPPNCPRLPKCEKPPGNLGKRRRHRPHPAHPQHPARGRGCRRSWDGSNRVPRVPYLARLAGRGDSSAAQIRVREPPRAHFSVVLTDAAPHSNPLPVKNEK